MDKKSYRVRNWKDYNKSLEQRGSLTFWFSPEVVADWDGHKQADVHGNQRYSDMVILCGLTFRQLFQLPYRATRGLMKSLVELMKLDVDTPEQSTFCRRSKTLQVNLGVTSVTHARHVLVDSTGIQVVGEGQWKVLRHGVSRHQLWRKLHIAIDADNQTVLAATMTESVRLDGNYLSGLIDAIEGPLSQITGDGAYDKRNCYQAAHQRGAKPVFPPQHDAAVQRTKFKKDPALVARDHVIEQIGRGEQQAENKRRWKRENNYHRRSLIETMMWRMKTLFSDQMRSRTFENQRTDLLVRCYAVNKINQLGLPQSVCVA